MSNQQLVVIVSQKLKFSELNSILTKFQGEPVCVDVRVTVLLFFALCRATLGGEVLLI